MLDIRCAINVHTVHRCFTFMRKGASEVRCHTPTDDDITSRRYKMMPAARCAKRSTYLHIDDSLTTFRAYARRLGRVEEIRYTTGAMGRHHEAIAA